MTDRIGRRAVVAGRVQGVGFRFATVAEAERLGLEGWVRNRPDGAVEAKFSGSAEAVGALVEWLHHGPPSALVERVDVEEITLGEPRSGFSIR